MFYKILEANESGEVTKEQVDWLLNCHATMAQTLMHIYMMTQNADAKKTLNDLEILISTDG